MLNFHVFNFSAFNFCHLAKFCIVSIARNNFNFRHPRDRRKFPDLRYLENGILSTFLNFTIVFYEYFTPRKSIVSQWNRRLHTEPGSTPNQILSFFYFLSLVYLETSRRINLFHLQYHTRVMHSFYAIFTYFRLKLQNEAAIYFVQAAISSWLTSHCLRATTANLVTSRCLTTHSTLVQLCLSFQVVLLSASLSLLASTLGPRGLTALMWIATPTNKCVVFWRSLPTDFACSCWQP